MNVPSGRCSKAVVRNVDEALAGFFEVKNQDAGHVALYGIYFDVDKATLRPDSEAGSSPTK